MRKKKREERGKKSTEREREKRGLNNDEKSGRKPHSREGWGGKKENKEEARK